MLMGKPDRGDVLMLPNGELVVYAKIMHRVYRTVEDTGVVLDLSEEDTTAAKLIGALGNAFAGLAKLCALPILPTHETRFLVCKHDLIFHGKPFLTLADAQAWIDADWGGGGGDNPYWIAAVQALVPNVRKPWGMP